MHRNSFIAVCALLAVAGASMASPAGAGLRLAPLFTDNMVLQQRAAVPVWGWGTPGEQVTLSATWGGRAETAVGAGGSWKASLRTPEAGGPFTIEVREGNAPPLYINNVMTGEVWLCSGQSNMEMPLMGWPPSDTIQSSAFEIRNSANCAIRFFTVARLTSGVPESTCTGQWVEASPAVAAQFSATGWFFAKNLQRALRVPVGMIHSSWGGTPVEAWMSAGAISSFPEYDTTMRKVAASKEGRAILDRWFGQFPVQELRKDDPENRWKGLRFDDDSCAATGFRDDAWRSMKLPVYWEATEVGDIDGIVWFRKRVQLPAPWVGRDLVVELGPIDDMDVTYVNGARVGGIETEGAWKTNRTYPVPATLVRDSSVQISVRVIDYQGGGGIWGNGQPMVLRLAGPPSAGGAAKGTPDAGSVIRLEGEWKYLPVAELYGGKLHIFGAKGEKFSTRPKLPIDIGPNTPTMLYNGMIAPLLPFAIKGAIWYQGESNVGNPKLYGRLFPAMIADWRRAFSSSSMPFYFVQIAPYNYSASDRSELLREAQMKTLGVANTGMAVTLDIGNPANIHPAYKPALGERLARLALAGTYGRSVPFSGPALAKVRLLQATPGKAGMPGIMELTFHHAEKGLVLREANGENGFRVAGPDSIFHPATVKVSGSRLLVSSPEVARPLAVRYAFVNAPEATLFNKEGLPSSSFRTDDWGK